MVEWAASRVAAGAAERVVVERATAVRDGGSGGGTGGGGEGGGGEGGGDGGGHGVGGAAAT